MRKSKDYRGIRFHARIYRKVVEASCRFAKDPDIRIQECSTGTSSEQWGFDKLEEFYSSLASEDITKSTLQLFWDNVTSGLFVTVQHDATHVIVNNSERHGIEAIFSIFEEAGPEDRLTLLDDSDRDEKARVFIGHGRNPQWEKLKAHLQDKHGLDVVCYETGARAGHTIRDILDSMAEASSFALLVLTGEDKTDEGLRARQNVIHECGLFQGRLGFDRAILLVEDGVQLASNFDGIQQLRFKRGQISGIFGDVLATIRREFGPI
ncbi:hypothetical protein ACVW1A_006984 [Bradyrhizobium sp. LB1.3]|jgi:hypothetical protein